jgi:hypothetical protein
MKTMPEPPRVTHRKKGIVFPETRKIVMGSPLDFTRENIRQYWF